MDALHQQGLETGHLTVEDYVRRMREDRMNMVQNVVSFKGGNSLFKTLFSKLFFFKSSHKELVLLYVKRNNQSNEDEIAYSIYFSIFDFITTFEYSIIMG